MEYIQNRIYADNEDEAAMRIRKKHNEYEGSLHLKKVIYVSNWYEYCIELRRGS